MCGLTGEAPVAADWRWSGGGAGGVNRLVRALDVDLLQDKPTTEPG